MRDREGEKGGRGGGWEGDKQMEGARDGRRGRRTDEER